MKVEISLLVNLIESHVHRQNWFDEQIDLGNQVSIRSLAADDWYEKILSSIKAHNDTDYERIMARKRLDDHSYTHRYCAMVSEVANLNDPKVRQARQWLSRAIVLTNIVHPLPLPINPPAIFRIVSDEGKNDYRVILEWAYSQAYYPSLKHPGSLGSEKAKNIARLWPSLQRFYTDNIVYERIIRALWYYNEASHICGIEMSHLARHAALESLICVGSHKNRQQILQRLPKLVNGITPKQAADIYDLCVDIKHNAAPSLNYSSGINDLDPRDTGRVEGALLLDFAVRSLFIEALQDLSFAKLLATPALLKKKYPII